MATVVPVIGLCGLVVNDALLKIHMPGVLSGKISDFAVVLFFPFLVTATWAFASQLGRAVRGLFLRRRLPPDPGIGRGRLIVALAITTFSLSAVNLSTTARDYYLVLLDHLDVLRLMPTKGYTVDPTDLIGLTMLPISWWWGSRLIGRRVSVVRK